MCVQHIHLSIDFSISSLILVNAGKSRADLWQLAANVGLEIEMARANYGCTHKVMRASKIFLKILVILSLR